jgi:hypothetical protein
MLPLQYSIYKGTGGKHGALQFNFQPPHYYKGLGKSVKKDFTGQEAMDFTDGRPKLKEGWKTRDGAIFLEITSAVGKNEYDWNNKITMALSPNDMGQFLFCLLTGKECKIMHDPGAKTEAQNQVKKYLNLASPKGVAEGILVNASIQSAEGTKHHMVPINGYEVVILRSLFQRAISSSLSW